MMIVLTKDKDRDLRPLYYLISNSILGVKGKAGAGRWKKVGRRGAGSASPGWQGIDRGGSPGTRYSQKWIRQRAPKITI